MTIQMLSKLHADDFDAFRGIVRRGNDGKAMQRHDLSPFFELIRCSDVMVFNTSSAAHRVRF